MSEERPEKRGGGKEIDVNARRDPRYEALLVYCLVWNIFLLEKDRAGKTGVEPEESRTKSTGDNNPHQILDKI